MKTAFEIICVTLAAHYVAAQCPNFKTYTTELKPACDVNDIYVKWPNYANLSTYYTCFGVGNPVLTPCPSGEYFAYVFQQCTNCNEYIPAPPCANLKTQNPPNCVPIGNGGNGGNDGNGGNGSSTTAQSLPTPYYPTTVSTTTTTKRTTVTKPPVTKPPVTQKPTAAPPTAQPPTAQPPTAAPTTPSAPVPTPPSASSTAFPGPPVPSTNAPGIPSPPTPAPTPPIINLTPPSA